MNRKTKIGLALAAACALAAAAWHFGPPGKESAAKNSPKERPARTAAAMPYRGSIELEASAPATAAAFAVAQVKPRVEGLLLKFEVAEGQTVNAGDPIARLDPAPYKAALDQALGNLARDEALLANARNDLARYKTLAAEGAGSQQQLDTQAALARQYAGTVAADKAAAQTARLNLSYATVTAPIPGVVGIRSADPGNIVRPSDASGIATVATVSPMSAVFTLSGDEALRAAPGAKAIARDKSGNVLAQGSVAAVDNQVDPSTGSRKARAVFPEGNIVPGSYLRLTVGLGTAEGLIVPLAALAKSGNDDFVWFIQNQASRRAKAKIIGKNAQFAAIEADIPANAPVAVDGLDRLRENGPAEAVLPAEKPQEQPQPQTPSPEPALKAAAELSALPRHAQR